MQYWIAGVPSLLLLNLQREEQLPKIPRKISDTKKIKKYIVLPDPKSFLSQRN